MEKLLKVLLLTFAFCLPAYAQVQVINMQVKCAPTEELIPHVRDAWKEEVTMTGTLPGDDNIVVSVWMGKERSVTIVHTFKHNGMSCIVSGIENLKYVNGV